MRPIASCVRYGTTPEPSEKRGRVLLKACGDELLSHIVLLEIDWREDKPGRKRDLSFGQALEFPCLRRGVVHLIDADLCAMGIAESESVESRAKDDDLPNPSFDGSRRSIFRNSASRGSEQTSDAGRRVCVRELKHVLFVFPQNLQSKWVIEDCAMIERLMSSPLPRDDQGCAAGFIRLHVRGLRSH